MARVFINSRADFFRVLDQTLEEARRFSEMAPGFTPMETIVKELEAMKAWTADGREPTLEERGRIDIGPIAIRELEPVETEEQDNFHLRLHELNGYFEDWPED